MNVFTYGTLMFAPVWHAVTGRLEFGERAELPGFVRRAFRERSYPGVVAGEGAVEGVLYRDVDAATLDLLDAFEGVFYERERVTVDTAGGSAAAVTYVVAPAHRDRLGEVAWDPEEFPRHIATFVTQCDRFRATGSWDRS